MGTRERLEARRSQRENLPTDVSELYDTKLMESNRCVFREGEGPEYICNCEGIEAATCTLDDCFLCPQRKLVSLDRPVISLGLITICITYYRRPECLARLLRSIERFYPELEVEVLDTKGNLSWGRNELSRRCKTPYYFMFEEDMECTDKTDILSALKVMEKHEHLSGIGGKCYEPGRDKVSWQHDFAKDCTDPKNQKGPSTRPTVNVEGVTYQPCDLVLNFGLFRNTLFKEVRWDEERPVGEHTEFYYRASKTHQFGYLEQLECLHHRDRHDALYQAQRGRARHIEPFELLSRKQIGFASILTSCTTALKEIGVKFFLSDGTLLGSQREGRFIEHDPDIDIGIFSGYDRERVVQAMKGAGFTFEKKYGTDERGLQLVFRKNTIKLDIFTYYKEGEFCYHPVWDRGRLIKYHYKSFTLTKFRFMTMDVLIPANPLEYLVQQYGEDWKVPVKKWDWRTSPRNLNTPIPALDKPNIVIIGVGHSNTTLLSKQLVQLGWEENDNDEEFGESVSIRDLDREFSREGTLDEDVYRSALSALKQPWVVKDPAMNKTNKELCIFDVMSSVFNEFETTLVWISKNLDDVEASFNRRNVTPKHIKHHYATCERVFHAWQRPKVHITAEDIGRACEMFDSKRTPPRTGG